MNRMIASLVLFTLIAGCMQKVDNVPARLDHLVYTTSDLSKGMDEIEQLLGVRPVHGGRHPDFGTHNALVALGDSIYLEILAPDPELPAPIQGRLFEQTFTQNSKLTTWVMRATDLDKCRELAMNQGLRLGAVQAGSREKPDGTVLTWKLTDPHAFPYDGAVPFLIDWEESIHPAQAIPAGGELLELVIGHPEPEAVRSRLAILGINMRVTRTGKPQLVAKIRSKEGIVIIQ